MNKLSDEKIYELYDKIGSKRAVSKELNMPRSTVRAAIERFEEKNNVAKEQKKSALELKNYKLTKQVSELKSELTRANDQRLNASMVKEFIIGLNSDSIKNEKWEVLKNNNSSTPTPHLMLSDLHWGEVVDPNQVANLNTYNIEVAKQRLKTCVQRYIHVICDKFNNGKHDVVYVHLNGDILSGNIHEELAETNDVPIGLAFISVQQELIKILNTLVDKFGKVHVISTHGNHSRLNKKYRHKDGVYNNLDYLLGVMLQKWFEDDDRFNFVISESQSIDFTVNGTEYRQTHGNQFRGGAGFLGCLAPITRGEHKMRIATQSYKEPYQKLLVGHFHTSLFLPRVIANGSLVGFNEYAYDNDFPFDYPKQVGWFTDRELGSVTPIEIRCDLM
jgi:DNA-binding MarR family transcriptional regulator